MSNKLQTNLDNILADKHANLLPENLRKGVTLLGVEGTLEPSLGTGVKLFKTQEEMQADTTAKEGDLAVVYKKEMQNITADSEVTQITFPETVTLPAVYTDNCDATLRALDSSIMFEGNCMLDQNSFRFEGYSDTGVIRVEYTSTDGITYTRARFRGDSGDLTNPVQLPTTCKVERAENWNDNLGYFMQTGGMNFDGMYEYSLDKDYIQFLSLDALTISNINLNDSTMDVIIDDTNKAGPFIDRNKLNSIIADNNLLYSNCVFFINSSNELIYSDTLGPVYSLTGALLGYGLDGNYTNKPHDFYKIDMNKNIIEKVYTKAANTKIYVSSDRTSYYLPKEELDCITLPTYINSSGFTYPSYDVEAVSTDASNIKIIYKFQLVYNYQANKYKYLPAENQFNLTSSNELLPGKIAYGRKGIVTGDGSIYENLDNYKVLSAFFDLNDIPDYAKAKTSTEVSIDKYVPYGLSRVLDLINGYNTLHYAKSPINNNIVNYDGIPRPRSNREYFQKIGTKLYSLRSPNASTAPYLGYSLITLDFETNTTQVEQIISQGDTSYSCDWAILNDALYFIHVKTSSDDGITKTIEFSKYDLVSKEIKIIEVISVTATAQNTSCRPFISIYNNEIYYGYTNSLSTTSYKKETSYTIKKYEKDTITTVFTSKNYNSDATNCGVTSDGKYFALTYAGGVSQSNAVFSFAEHIEKTFQHTLPVNSVYATSGIYEYDDKLYFAASNQTSDTKSRVLFDFKNNLYSLVDLTDIDTSQSLLYKFGDSTFIRTNQFVNGCYIYYQLHNENSLVATESFKTPRSLILSVDENSIIDCLTDIYQMERINNGWLCHALSTGKAPTLTYNLSPCIHYKENVIKDELLKPASSDILVCKDDGLSTILLNITSPHN